MRLSSQTLSRVSSNVVTPSYEREAAGVGIVHFGPGAFMRAHQAVFTDDAMAKSGGDWGICAVSLNSPTARDALAPQDGLYTLAIRDQVRSYRVIGAIKEVLFAGDDRETVMDRLCSPETRFVTLTITEKGYALDGSGHLDLKNPMVEADRANPEEPVSAMAYIVLAAKRRLAAGLAPLCVISCDNLPNNGDRLRTVCAELAAAIYGDGALADFIQSEMKFPNTMVDSITPATNDDIIDDVEAALGLRDEGTVQREAFTQWVIEDDLPEARPDWEGAGVIITSDVHAYELTKLRILNGAHSSLTYLGLLLGHGSVSEAASDPILRTFVDHMIRDETIPTIAAPPGLDLTDYWNATLERFDNPHIVHRLEQISHDGSQKIPARILPIILYHGVQATRATRVLAAWIYWTQIRRTGDQNPTDKALFRIDGLPDPALSVTDYARAMLGLSQIFPNQIREDDAVCTAVCDAAADIERDGLRAVLERE